MSHETHTGDAIAGVGTVLLNIMTWSGMVEAMKGVQIVLTMAVSLAMIAYYVFGALEKHKSIKRKK